MEFSAAVVSTGMEFGKFFRADWNNLGNVVSELASCDTTSKTELLHSLAFFLSCVEATMSFSAEHNSVSAWVAGSRISLRQAEVLQLHERMTKELKRQLAFLPVAWTGHDHQRGILLGEGHFSNHVLDLEVVSQTLRCCLKMLRLVDYFDSNASRASKRMLNAILQDLCDPAKLLSLLGLRGQARSVGTETSFQRSQEYDDETWTFTENPYAFGHSCNCFSDRSMSYGNCIAGLSVEATQHRREIVFAITEVYVDELLLHPDLTSQLLGSQEENVSTLAEHEATIAVRCIEASLQAAFVHVLQALQPQPIPSLSRSTRSKDFRVCNLSLPASLVLLEKFSAEDIPPSYCTPVVRLLSGALEDSTHPNFVGADNRSCRLVYNSDDSPFWVGGVEWSRCRRERLYSCDPREMGAYPANLNPETTLSFTCSILECAILAFMRIVSTVNSGPGLHRKAQNSDLNSYLLLFMAFFPPVGSNTIDATMQAKSVGSKFLSLGQHNWLCSAFEERDIYGGSEDDSSYGISEGASHLSEDCLYHQNSSCNGPCFNTNDIEKFQGLVRALLQLIRCALERTGKEICKLPSFGHQFCNDMTIQPDSFPPDFENILYCVGLHLTSCVPSIASMSSERKEQIREREKCVDSELIPCECVPLHSFAGRALLLFSNILQDEVQKGSPDVVLEEYFYLLESLVALLLALDAHYKTGHPFPGGNSDGSFRRHDCSCRCSEIVVHKSCCPDLENEQLQPPLKKSTYWFIEELLGCLRAVLHNILIQNRKMPEFLLTFTLEHISREDGFRIVTMVLTSFSISAAEVQQNMDHGTNLVYPEGLISDVLHVALSEPTRSSSLLALVKFMTDVLQDVPPVQPSSTLPDISKHICWYSSIATNLTLATRLAASEDSTFAEIGTSLFRCNASTMDQGIGRVFAEGTAIAQWLIDLGRTVSETVWHELAVSKETTDTGALSDETLRSGGSFASCCGFLNQVDTMRMSVENLVISGRFVGAEFTSWLQKGRIFVEQLLKLLASEEIPGFVKMLFISFSKQERTVRASERMNDVVANSREEHPRLDSGNRGTDAEQDYEKIPRTCIKASNYNPNSFPDEATFVKTQDEGIPDEQKEDPLCVDRVETDPSVTATINRVSSAAFTVELQQITTVTLFRVESEPAEYNASDKSNATVAPRDRKRWPIPTSVIVKRLLQKTRASKRSPNNSCIPYLDKRIHSRWKQAEREGASRRNSAKMIWEHEDFEDDLTDDGDFDKNEDGMDKHTSKNSYLDLQRTRDFSKGNFDDLKDFIVPKDGRDYSVWLKKRQNMRRRAYRKNFFKRLREKQEFLLLMG